MKLHLSNDQIIQQLTHDLNLMLKIGSGYHDCNIIDFAFNTTS